MFLFEWIRPKAEKLNYWRGQDTTDFKGVSPYPLLKKLNEHFFQYVQLLLKLNTLKFESYLVFSNILQTRKAGPKRKLSLKEEFVITLVRLKRGFDVEVLGDLVGIHPSSISRIFTTWINFLYLELNFLISWANKEQITANLPKAFKYFPKTRSIIDCTEFFIQKPSLPSSQRVTWSNYKHHNTLKALISISPTGSFTFISKLFTGSISDRRIVEESGYLEYLEHGDDIMADRGFLIRDLLARRSCTLNIPPYSMGRQLSSRAVTKTRRIASARIHVERAIGRLKTFKILQGTMPLRLHPLFDQVLGVCACICNLDSRLVK